MKTLKNKHAADIFGTYALYIYYSKLISSPRKSRETIPLKTFVFASPCAELNYLFHLLLNQFYFKKIICPLLLL